MEFLVIGIVSAINMIIIKIKFEKKRYEDATFDLFLMGVLVVLFSGSYAGMVVAMVASMFISLYLLASPPKFTKKFNINIKKHINEANKRNGFKDFDI